MKNPIIEAHPALTIAYCPENKKLLLAVYDAGYRGGKGPYPTKPNCIGGNPPPGNNPLEVLVREISEEYKPEFQIKNPRTNKFGQTVNWATPKDISLVRDGLLHNLQPFQDFLVDSISFGEGTVTYSAIYSYFHNQISKEVIECVESNLRRQKTLTPEGLTGVYTIDELVNDARGKFSTAHITAHALNKYFDSNIPHPSEIQANPLGEPRKSFREYLSDFEYSKEQKPNHNNPEKKDPSFYDILFNF